MAAVEFNFFSLLVNYPRMTPWKMMRRMTMKITMMMMMKNAQLTVEIMAIVLLEPVIATLAILGMIVKMMWTNVYLIHAMQMQRASIFKVHFYAPAMMGSKAMVNNARMWTNVYLIHAMQMQRVSIFKVHLYAPAIMDTKAMVCIARMWTNVYLIHAMQMQCVSILKVILHAPAMMGSKVMVNNAMMWTNVLLIRILAQQIHNVITLLVPFF